MQAVRCRSSVPPHDLAFINHHRAFSETLTQAPHLVRDGIPARPNLAEFLIPSRAASSFFAFYADTAITLARIANTTTIHPSISFVILFFCLALLGPTRLGLLGSSQRVLHQSVCVLSLHSVSVSCSRVSMAAGLNITSRRL